MGNCALIWNLYQLSIIWKRGSRSARGLLRGAVHAARDVASRLKLELEGSQGGQLARVVRLN